MSTNSQIQEKHGKHKLGYHSELGEYDSGDCQEIMLNEARADTAKQIFDKLDKVIPIDKCKCGHDKSDHDDESCDMSCMECRCIEYKDNDFISEYLKLKTIFEMKSKLGKKLKY